MSLVLQVRYLVVHIKGNIEQIQFRSQIQSHQIKKGTIFCMS